MPLVSVLMPVYNGEKYLREAIDSVLAQTYINWELIIVNDGSTDNTKNIIHSYTDSRIRYFENEKNMGLGFVRNRTVELAKGKYCAILDSDDIALPQRLAQQVRFLEHHSNYGLCGSWAKSVDGTINYTYPSNNEIIKCSLMFHLPFIHSATMVHTSLLQKNSYDAKFAPCEDYNLIIRLSEQTKMANLRKYLVRYRTHAENISLLKPNKEARDKNRIIATERLNFMPDEKELELQSLLTNVKRYKDLLPIDFLSQLKQLLRKIVAANRQVRYYNQTSLQAYLWFRWILACVVLREKKQLLNSGLTLWNMRVIMKLSGLLFEKMRFL